MYAILQYNAMYTNARRGSFLLRVTAPGNFLLTLIKLTTTHVYKLRTALHKSCMVPDES